MQPTSSLAQQIAPSPTHRSSFNICAAASVGTANPAVSSASGAVAVGVTTTTTTHHATAGVVAVSPSADETIPNASAAGSGAAMPMLATQPPPEQQAMQPALEQPVQPDQASLQIAPPALEFELGSGNLN